MKSFVFEKAKRFADSIENAVWTNQFDNTANMHAHYETTGPEIWQETSKYTWLQLQLWQIQWLNDKPIG